MTTIARGGGCHEKIAAALNDGHGHLVAAVGDLTRLLDQMTPTVVGQETVVLDAGGGAFRQFRVPFRALYVESQSTKLLTVANSTLQSAAPVAGPGVAFVNVGGAAVINFRAYQWSIYGGVAGELVTVTAFGTPMPPFSR